MTTRILSQILALAALSAVALGVRILALESQILGGDELHLLRVMAAHSIPEIAGLVTETDFSIPLAIFIRLVTSWVPLCEIGLRLPLLILGSLTPVLMILGVRRWVSLPTAWLLGLVVTAHPMLIFYSRFLRPYGPCLVLLFLVLLAHDSYLKGGRRSRLVVSVVLAGLASWLQLVALITAGCLFGATLFSALCFSNERRWTRGVEVFAAGIATLGLTLLLYLPALGGIRDQIVGENLGQGSLTSDDYWRNASVLAGFPGRAVAVVLAGLCIVGFIRHLFEGPRTAIWLALPVVGQLVVVLLIKPRLLQFSFVLARYVLYVLPIALLFACSGFEALVGRFLQIVLKPRDGQGRAGWGAAGIGAGLIGAWFLFGPALSIYRSGRAYSHHNVYQELSYLSNPRYRAQETTPFVPRIYRHRDIAEAPLLLEAPAAESFYDNPYVLYQHHHGRPIRLFVTNRSFWADPRLALGNVVFLREDGQPSSLCPSGTLVLLHTEVSREILQFLGHHPSRAAAEAYGVARVGELREELNRWCGAPVERIPGLEIYRVPGPASGKALP